MKSYPDRVIPIVYHYGNPQYHIDDLSLGMSSQFVSEFNTGVTVNLNINRKVWNKTIMHGSTAENRVNWYNYAELAEETIAGINIRHSWNSKTRYIDGFVDVEFDQAPDGSTISVALFIVEDSVVGGARYDQYTDYTWNGAYPELEKVGTYIKKDSVHFTSGHWIEGYANRWAFRESIIKGNFWGTTKAIPTDATVGTTYSVPFSHTLPTDYYDLDVIDKNINLVAFVSYKNKEVLNAEQANLISDATEIKTTKPNFKRQNMSIVLNGNQVYLKGINDAKRVEFYSLNGKRISSFTLNKMESSQMNFKRPISLIPGMFIVRIITNNGRSFVSPVQIRN